MIEAEGHIMLVEFRVENHRSLRDEQALTMEASKGAADDPRSRLVAGSHESILPVAVIYGANASGKSNILNALSFMRLAVTDSHRSWPPEGGVPREPFAWGPCREKPSFFEMTMLLGGVKYQYGFEASDACFNEEWLYAWPHGKKATLFERDKNDFKFGDSLGGENKLIVEVTRPNALFLSAAAQHRHPTLFSIYVWFRSIRSINLSGLKFFRSFPGEYRWNGLAELLSEPPTLFDMEEGGGIEERFRQMLKNADIGIVDFRIVKSEHPDERGLRRVRSRLQFKHKSSFDDSWLSVEEESRGTQTLLNMVLPILQSLRFGTLLVVDELEASLHPMLAQEIVRWFNDPKYNPNNAQLIFSTHDTNLMGTVIGEPALRRDQVWFTEKDNEGATEFYPLTNYKPRKEENLERGYLQGRYGAIPFLGNFFMTETPNESSGPTT